MTHADDWQEMRACIRLGRKILAQPAMADHVGSELAPGAGAQSDEALDAFIRQKLESAYHPCGTCRMGTDPLAVVGPDCRVIGLRNLRVVDASIMPQATAGDLNGPTIMLAERAADIIRQNLLPEATNAPLMAASDWRDQQRSPSITRNCAGERLELSGILATEMTQQETDRDMTMTKTRRFGLLAAALTAVSLVAPSMVAAEVPQSPDPIRIAVNVWTGQVLSANIAGEVLKKMGYNVEMVIAGALPQLVAIAEGEIDMNPEMWDNSVTDAYANGVVSGDIVVPGPPRPEPREGWVYPPCMEDLCPGLPSYQALYDCAQTFGTAETFPNGRLVGYPADWGTRVQDAVGSLGMPFNVLPGGSEGAMLAS